ncbi:hypothetical protein BLEM_0838 [Bifidobacterium lemurum]|uniref:GPI inositol-deacylase PGAP1-like alpha/beta domain-containing protein n=1 Tax=Bifidobacterium lemurum TaxID=1603886 RepID=A0A261FSY8_9BIFI|nr:alpha/beta fold hydrolase [Bifidobacterium lemurum]OZG62292.1 hypothetical protein BLEM_0838 [Bifidobacterium lemurum]QOL33658.1 alpha/beta fold hydrolase [Bifidobacterium lemurum]
MSWQVTSHIYGGKGFAPATVEEYARIARALDSEACALGALSASWSSTGVQLGSHRVSAPMCPTLASGDITAVDVRHTTLPFTTLAARCSDHAVECRRLGDTLADMARLLIRAHSLYADAELASRRILTEVVQVGTQLKPGYAAAGTGALAAGGLLAGWAVEGKPNPAWMSTTTARFQEGVMSGVGAKVGGVPSGVGLVRTDEVNTAAGRIAGVSAPVKNLAQGDRLRVREVVSHAPVVRSSASVGESLENLRRLAEERLGKVDLDSGLEYATIAIQRYERADGSNAWLVTIPGTDGKPDSPFGWAQNVELMSADANRRMSADSARMVVEAMEQAGIGADEPVALIGHSQGGIVAAAIAADKADDYNIQHVVTAGSPVANHPIGENTWVTSIEVEDELVAALDGAENPATDNWLTVRGTVSLAPEPTLASVDENGSCTPGSTPVAGSTPFDAAPVLGSTTQRELSHWLKYHQAAYQNATDLGSPALQRHEQHFRQTIAGELKETRYFEGRMTRSTTLAPAESDSPA